MTKWMLEFAFLLGGSFMPAISAAEDVQAPRIFAPGVISSAAADAAITFTADGREAYFERGNGAIYTIMMTRREPDGWSKPAITSFSGRWMDMEPAIAPDGSYLVFVSNRPLLAGQPPLDGFYYGKAQKAKGGALWRVDREGTGWSNPHRLPETVNGGKAATSSIYEPSIAANGDLYFQRADADGSRFRLYVSHRVGEEYGNAEPIDLGGDPKSSDMDPAIARDGSFLLFASIAARPEVACISRSARTLAGRPPWRLAPM